MSAQSNIFDRLKLAPTYHPGSVELFDDITLEPGDIVTIRSGQTDQAMPIYNQHITWNGKAMTTLESTGNEQRSALPPLQKKGKNGSYGAGRALHEEEQKTDGYWSDYINEKEVVGMIAGCTGIVLDSDGNPVIDPATGKFVYDNSSAAEIYARLLVTANRASLISAINNGQGDQISGASIDLEASGNAIITAINDSRTGTATIKGDRIKLSSTSGSCIEIENDGTVKITASNVINKINNNASGSHIDAGKIYLNGEVIANSIDAVEAKIDNITADRVIANTVVRAAYIQGTNIDASQLVATGTIAGDTVVGRNIGWVDGDGTYTYLGLKTVSIAGTGVQNLYLAGSGSVSTLSIPDAVSDLQIVAGSTSGTYKLQKKTNSSPSAWVDVGSFNTATSLSGGWSGRNYIVTASPQGNTKTGIVYNGLVPTGSVTKSGKNVSKSFIVYSDDGEGNADEIIMTHSVTISATSVYEDGYSDGSPRSGVAGGRTSGVSALVHDFTITKGDGTTATLNIDCTSIYSTARNGYTKGVFTLSTVTLEGAQDSVYIEASSGGTDYYQADTAKDYYPGDGGSFTPQGTAYGNITPIGSTTYYYVRHAVSETPTSAWYTRQTSQPASGTQFDRRYAAGDVITNLRNPGSGTKYARGTKVSVTPIKTSTKKHLLSTIRYKKGTDVTDTYYTKS